MRVKLAPAGTDRGDLQRNLLALLEGPKHAGSGAIPTSIRFLFYELVQMGVVQKKALTQGGRRPDQYVSDATMVLRRLGLVPWEWIRDETRSLTQWDRSTSMYEYLEAEAKKFRLDCWAGEPAPMILTESRSLAGVLVGIAYEYLCPIAATNGQVGGVLHTDVIPALVEGQTVIYLGDLDNQGADIEANTRAEIENDVGELNWARLALTPAQVEQYQIPSKPKTDKRYTVNLEKRESVAYETEALSQTVIMGLVRDRLAELLPEPLDEVLVRQQAMRTKAAARMRRWAGR